MKKAIFLDRDGVINEERKDYVKNLNEFKILKNVDKAIKLIKEKGFLAIVITNQSAINRGLLSKDVLNHIHNRLQVYLQNADTKIDSFYFCPHRPDENCFCRKPKPQMIFSAARDFGIDLKKSFFIGDSKKDIDAAKNAGCNGIMLKKNQSLFDCVLELFNLSDF